MGSLKHSTTRKLKHKSSNSMVKFVRKAILQQCHQRMPVLANFFSCKTIRLPPRLLRSRHNFKTVAHKTQLQGCGVKDTASSLWHARYSFKSVAYKTQLQVCGIQNTASSTWPARHNLKPVTRKTHLQACGLQDTASNLSLARHIFKSLACKTQLQSCGPLRHIFKPVSHKT